MILKSRSVVAKFPKLVAMLVLCAGVFQGAQAQDAAKIGFVRSDRIIAESNLAKVALSKLEAEFAKRDKELQDMAARFKSLSEKFDKDAAVMSESDRVKRQRELGDLDKEFQRKQREYREDAAQRRNEELTAVQERALKVIKQVAEAEKYDVVLQDAVWFNPKIDITDKILKVLNAAK
jgi:outer membrane protein